MEDMKMPVITKFDIETYNAVLDDLMEASQEVAKKYGLEITSTRGGSLTDGISTFRLQAIVPGVAEANYSEYAESLGLPKDGLGKSFRQRRHTYKITGLKPGCTYEVVTTREDGRRYDWRLAVVAELLNVQETEKK
jgi:hypothetical protein